MSEATKQSARANQLLISAIKAPENLIDLSLPDWELLLRVARRVRLLGRLGVCLSQAGLLDKIPPRAQDHLRAASNVIDHRSTLVRWEMNRILWAVKNTDINIILLKGAAYVLAGLPVARGRLFVDVDLLVAEDQLAEFEQNLLEKGWFRTEIDPYDDRYYRVWMHEIPPLRHRERGTEIDIHHRIQPRTSHYQIEPKLLLEAARKLDGSRLRILAPADMLLHAIVHLFLEGDPQEGLRFRDLLDIDGLLRHFGHDPSFWDALVSRSRQLNLERPLFYGFRYSQLYFSTPIPQQVLEDVNRAGPIAPIRALMDLLVKLSILPGHPDFPLRTAALARQLVYMRAHWLRMPVWLLARHLLYKAHLRFRGVGKKVDLAQLDLRQQ
jgi:hypothetical protein